VKSKIEKEANPKEQLLKIISKNRKRGESQIIIIKNN
jgi:hypothetical protein